MSKWVRKGPEAQEKEIWAVLDMGREREYAHPFFCSRLVHGPSELEYALAITI